MSRMPDIAVLAGGLATRMRPLTEKVPKSLLEAAGEPFVAHQLRLFQRQGFSRVVLCTGFLGEMITDFVGDGSRFGLEVLYSPDGPNPMGTGGALCQALPLLGQEFFVTYGDSYLDVEFAPILEAFHRGGHPGLMTVLHNAGLWDTSNVEFENGEIRRYSKTPTAAMTYIDFGLAMLSATALKQAPQPPFDLSQLYSAMVERGEMTGYEVHKRFYEIGSKTGLAETEQYLLSRP
jgi:NDP-sugar pyrophosphorylase family protein